MLERLAIRDFALIERADLELGPGLNALTGETGAGKSLLVQAVDLIVGGRADTDTVRAGARAAVVEGEFRLAAAVAGRVGPRLAEWGVDFDGETVIVRREVLAGGKSRATVNEAAVTVGSLRRLGELLLDLHGQHEHQSLLRADAGTETLDRLAGLDAETARYAGALSDWRGAEQELERLGTQLATFADRRDWLEQAARELDEARLEEGEAQALAAEAARLAHADRLRALVATALEALAEGETPAGDALSTAAHAVEQAAILDPTLETLLPTLEEARIAAAETARALSGYVASLEADPQALEAVEARRALIARLEKRYRRDVPGLIAWRAELAAELMTGEDAGGALDRARARVAEAAATCRAAAQALSRRRRAAGREWGTRITRELQPLGFGRARLDFAVLPREEAPASYRPGGLDDVEIRFTANPGEPPRTLQRVASGGELSRIMLALKTALEVQDPVDVLLFDEVDSGIGGAVAQAVGERLRRLSKHRQVICVTHLPMIAALASHHVRVSKRTTGGRTLADLEAVTGARRVDELARMLAGERVTETTRRQAREMLGAAAG